MIFSQSGVAEKDAIFLTKDEDGLEAVWTLINYDPFNQVEYLIVKARDTVERFSIRLQEINKNMTELEWTILYSNGQFYVQYIWKLDAEKHKDLAMKVLKYFSTIEKGN